MCNNFKISGKKYTTISCLNNCCKIIQSVYKDVTYNDEFYSKPGKIKKSGCFIYDPHTEKILLVQSQGRFFGSPKGSLNRNENYIEGAIREVKEETGLSLSFSNLLNARHLYIKNTIYYIIIMNETYVIPQITVKNNDANSIGWINLNCLLELIKNNTIYINNHTKMLIKHIFNINIYNITENKENISLKELKYKINILENELVRELKL